MEKQYETICLGVGGFFHGAHAVHVARGARRVPAPFLRRGVLDLVTLGPVAERSVRSRQVAWAVFL